MPLTGKTIIDTKELYELRGRALVLDIDLRVVRSERNALVLDVNAMAKRIVELEKENRILNINVERLMRGPGTAVTLDPNP